MFGVFVKAAAVFIIVSLATFVGAALFQFGNFDFASWDPETRRMLAMFPSMATMIFLATELF